MARRGTKANPFSLGEVVLFKRLNRRAVVTRVWTPEYSMPWERQFSPIRYMVKLVDSDSDEEIVCQARDLEELKTWLPELGIWKGKE